MLYRRSSALAVDMTFDGSIGTCVTETFCQSHYQHIAMASVTHIVKHYRSCRKVRAPDKISRHNTGKGCRFAFHLLISNFTAR